ncbi:hypothetical protein BOTBODRAFT_176614 [Botryobasidium botryosum FD-172 SS1]|uniref:HNH nuclease domain-containing protein n=1 Tax=Botryobasidium botryosum (strain FD-172 SS1) TaxID=930990 RepID=A0A067M925_BOTB1|nr:hypothetical protein BOTBODRAFT_176614 [Botryobasidium botryosum FD-172 SS1]
MVILRFFADISDNEARQLNVDVDHPQNTLYLDYNMHIEFDEFKWCLMPIDVANRYEVKWLTSPVGTYGPYGQQFVEFTNHAHHPVALPDSHFPQIHAALAHVLLDSGVAEYMNKIIEKFNHLGISAPDDPCILDLTLFLMNAGCNMHPPASVTAFARRSTRNQCAPSVPLIRFIEARHSFVSEGAMLNVVFGYGTEEGTSFAYEPISLQAIAFGEKFAHGSDDRARSGVWIPSLRKAGRNGASCLKMTKSGSIHALRPLSPLTQQVSKVDVGFTDGGVCFWSSNPADHEDGDNDAVARKLGGALHRDGQRTGWFCMVKRWRFATAREVEAAPSNSSDST